MQKTTKRLIGALIVAAHLFAPGCSGDGDEVTVAGPVPTPAPGETPLREIVVACRQE